MTHRFPIKEIAVQAGVSEPTVDRVLNNRPNVSPQMRRRVLDALDELAGQEAQLTAKGRKLFIDIVAEAPERFLREIRSATLSAIGEFSSAVIRPRFTFGELIEPDQMAKHLDRVMKRGSAGVCIKARDVPLMRQKIQELTARRIPVVTVFTEINTPEVAGYVGIDNVASGRTAAFLISKMLDPNRKSQILASLSHENFTGEDKRLHGFRDALQVHAPHAQIHVVGNGAGLEMQTYSLIEHALSDIGAVDAIYSMGGGNKAIVQALDRHQIKPKLFVAHDLDYENRGLLNAGRIDFILRHDLTLDMLHAFEWIAQKHRIAPLREQNYHSKIEIHCKENTASS